MRKSKMNQKSYLSSTISALALAVLAPTNAYSDVILQYFESKYNTMEHRMPDIFMAGYDALWIPPTGKADTGALSVGYDVFDRFDLNNLYGNGDQLTQLIKEAHKAKICVYADIVLNHNGFRDLGAAGFVKVGDYPGFVVTLPNDIDGDFHGRFEGGRINERLDGLIDIAHEKNHQFIRHPVDPTDPRNIPDEKPVESNRQFYPDTDRHSPPKLGDTSSDKHSPSGFDLDKPEAGDPVTENATGLLLRYCKWMIEAVGVDGFRLDAAKSIAPFFWNDFYDPAVFQIAPGGSTPYSFGEVVAGTNELGLLKEYSRKDGFGNRDVLDFPLYFTMHDVFNAHGFGDMRRLERASADGLDGNPNDGTFGVTFCSNHDGFAPPPEKDNIAYAHILTRTGYPIVYFNALEFGTWQRFSETRAWRCTRGQVWRHYQKAR